MEARKNEDREENGLTTIGHIDLAEGLNGDFDRARRMALVRGVLARLRGDREHRRLFSFEESGAAYCPRNRSYAGRRSVEVGRIVGSVGRAGDFDGSFLPTTRRVGERWKRVNRAFRRAEALPPVRLHKVSDSYFVEDGNHRVSVARYHGVEWIDAEVTEFRAPAKTGRPQNARKESA
jgi:hypothetical protein